ncbi:hypothetical protein DL96DRAFT_1555252 [Flagelloscypha sp. PMI_526]|nr:hypothetical protein DL96DRAFT_1555252 [Flagelloscypha sp. PMI_526]
MEEFKADLEKRGTVEFSLLASPSLIGNFWAATTALFKVPINALIPAQSRLGCSVVEPQSAWFWLNGMATPGSPDPALRALPTWNNNTEAAVPEETSNALETYKKKDPAKASNRFQAVIQFLRKELGWKGTDPLVCLFSILLSLNAFAEPLFFSTTAAWG